MPGLLPISAKFKKKMKQSNGTAQQNNNWTVLEKALQIILEPLMATGKNEIILDRANLHHQECPPWLVALIEDNPEYCELYSLQPA